VKPNGRKYGNGQSRPIPVWNGILDHRERIGGAIWEFLWCLDKVSVEKDGVGMVLKGTPVKLEKIVAGIPGSDYETVRLHMITLEEHKYIRRRRTPYGFVIEVLNSKKFNIWKPENPQNTDSPRAESPQNTGREPVKHGQRTRENRVNKEDSTGTQVTDRSFFSVPQDPSVVVLPRKEGKKNGWVDRDQERKQGTAAALNRMFPEGAEVLAGDPSRDVPAKQLLVRAANRGL
jgi:hypothetical protein